MPDSATFTTPEADDEDTGDDLGDLDDLLASLRSDDEPAAIELVLQQTEMISEEWSREDLGKKIEAVVADALTQSGAIQAAEVTQ